MPIVSIKMVEGVFAQPELERLVMELTEAVVRVGGEGIRPGVHVTVELVKSGLWGTGGRLLRTDEILARRRENAGSK